MPPPVMLLFPDITPGRSRRGLRDLAVLTVGGRGTQARGCYVVEHHSYSGFARVPKKTVFQPALHRQAVENTGPPWGRLSVPSVNSLADPSGAPFGPLIPSQRRTIAVLARVRCKSLVEECKHHPVEFVRTSQMNIVPPIRNNVELRSLDSIMEDTRMLRSDDRILFPMEDQSGAPDEF